MVTVRERVMDRLDNLKDQMSQREPRQDTQLERAVERQTARIPTLGFVGLAVGSMVLSAAIEFLGRSEGSRNYGNFIGLWAPSFLLMGIYNKIVRLERSRELT